ncbi:MAG: methyltransferase domain-containing protein [Sumerlaeia bacterium]
MTDKDAIHLLTPALVEQNPFLAIRVLGQSSRLAKPLGWHYLFDLVWILRELESLKPGSTVLEVGAGMGLLQFLLADSGYKVISADMGLRRPFAATEHLYRFGEMGTSGEIDHDYLKHHERATKPGVGLPTLNGILDASPRKALRAVRKLLKQDPVRKQKPATKEDRPEITLYRCDASNMAELKDNSVDAAVSVSALEHNPAEKVREINRECLRIVKPGGPILHTVSAVKEGSAFHEESFSYLLDEAGLTEAYDLQSPESNFADFDAVFAAIQEGRFLKDCLGHGYYGSGRNGMPWGIWNPAYQPVGVKKVVTE